MCKAMQPEKLVEDTVTEIISRPQKSLEDVFRAKAYLDRIPDEPLNSLSERMLDRCTDRFSRAKRLYGLAVMRNQLAIAELNRVNILAGCSLESIRALTLRYGHDIPTEEIARLLGRDERTIDSVIIGARHNYELGVRELFATRVDMADGRSSTWFEVRNEIQSHFREIQSLLADMRGLYGEYEQWRHDFQEYEGYDYEEHCDAEQRLECSAAGNDCEECVLEHSEPYTQAARLLHNYDRLLFAHLDAVTELLESLIQLKTNHLLPMNTDLPDGLCDALEADVDRYIDTPEMSAENLRKEYKAAIIEDNKTPLDGQTTDAYNNVCLVVECGRPHVFHQNLNWALRVMSVTLDHPALQVKALITSIEQAKAASSARGMPTD